MKNKDKWISCSKRLPELGQSVLAFARYGHMSACKYQLEGFMTYNQGYPLKLIPFEGVTHWCFLPDFPEDWK